MASSSSREANTERCGFDGRDAAASAVADPAILASLAAAVAAADSAAAAFLAALSSRFLARDFPEDIDELP